MSKLNEFREMIDEIDVEFLGFKYQMNQTHSNNIAVIDDVGSAKMIKNVSNSILQTSLDCSLSDDFYYVSSDALITSMNNTMLTVKAADCLPIFIVGDDYISVIHAGRKGTLAEITRDVVLFFKYLEIQTIYVWFGPSSCLSCYEIDRDTNTHYDLVHSNKDQIESIYSKGNIFYVNENGHKYCTQCNSDLFFSYRSGDEFDRNYFYLAKK